MISRGFVSPKITIIRFYCTSASIDFYAIHNIGRRLAALQKLYEAAEQKRPIIANYAWKEILNLTEAKIDVADVETTSKLLTSWRFFSTVWKNGKDGPADENASKKYGSSDTDQAYKIFLMQHSIELHEEVQAEVPGRGRLQRR